MKRRIGFAALFLFLVINAGCPYTTKTPLGAPERGAFDARLVGQWIAYGTEGDSALICVYPFNDAEYYVEMQDEDQEPSRFRVFAFTVGGERLLQVNDLDHEGAGPEYCFARYELAANGELAIRFVGEDCVPKTLAEDPKALGAFIAAHLDDPALDDEDTNLLLRRRP